VIFLAIVAALIAAISPFAGMIFTIFFGFKNQSKLYVFFGAFIGTTVLLYYSKILDPIRVMDTIVGIGLVSFLFIRNFVSSLRYLYSFISSALVAVGYALIRQVLFYDLIKQSAETFITEYDKFLVANFTSNPEQLELFQAAVGQIKPLFTDYYVGVWSSLMITGLFIAALLVSHRSKEKWQIKQIRMPFAFIYLLIACLALFLVANAQKYGINGLIIIAPFFLFQGISILFFFWGDFFKRSKFLSIVLIGALLINPYLMILIMLIGLFDIWFNFRKINNGGQR